MNNGSSALNDRGQLAFRYNLAEGRSGIALATPIPEPSPALLLIGAPIVLTFRACAGRPNSGLETADYAD